MVTDPIANNLTKIRNALHARHASVQLPASRTLLGILDVLVQKGYIAKYHCIPGKGKQQIAVAELKYYKQKPVIQHIKRISTPGLRQYTTAQDIPHVLNGLGIAILTTSKGILSDKEARKQHIGGEILCTVY